MNGLVSKMIKTKALAFKTTHGIGKFSVNVNNQISWLVVYKMGARFISNADEST